MMKKDAVPAAMVILEMAYEQFVAAYRALEEEEGGLDNPIIGEKFELVAKYFGELVRYLNETVHHVPHSAGSARTRNERKAR